MPPTFGGSGVAAEDIDNDGDIDAADPRRRRQRALPQRRQGQLHRRHQAAASVDACRRHRRRAAPADRGRLRQRRPAGRADHLRRRRSPASIATPETRKFEDVTERTEPRRQGTGRRTGHGARLRPRRPGSISHRLLRRLPPRRVLPTLSRRNSNALPDKLFRNKGNFVFEDVTAGSGIENTGWAQSVGHSTSTATAGRTSSAATTSAMNAWYRNLAGRHRSRTWPQSRHRQAELHDERRHHRLNRDGLPDVYISNIVTMDKDEKYVLPDTKTRDEVQSREDGQHARRGGERSLGLRAEGGEPAGYVPATRTSAADSAPPAGRGMPTSSTMTMTATTISTSSTA